MRRHATLRGAKRDATRRDEATSRHPWKRTGAFSEALRREAAAVAAEPRTPSSGASAAFRYKAPQRRVEGNARDVRSKVARARAPEFRPRTRIAVRQGAKPSCREALLQLGGLGGLGPRWTPWALRRLGVGYAGASSVPQEARRSLSTRETRPKERRATRRRGESRDPLLPPPQAWEAVERQRGAERKRPKDAGVVAWARGRLRQGDRELDVEHCVWTLLSIYFLSYYPYYSIRQFCLSQSTTPSVELNARST